GPPHRRRRQRVAGRGRHRATGRDHRREHGGRGGRHRDSRPPAERGRGGQPGPGGPPRVAVVGILTERSQHVHRIPALTLDMSTVDTPPSPWSRSAPTQSFPAPEHDSDPTEPYAPAPTHPQPQAPYTPPPAPTRRGKAPLWIAAAAALSLSTGVLGGGV